MTQDLSKWKQSLALSGMLILLVVLSKVAKPG
jgi:hypothetical protein